jgi:2-C-methyl-D-erythritol 2,4-cyclodiphosphate synthase
MSNNNSLRIGQGYDVHKLISGRKLILGGVEIPFNKGLEGHSDADVLLHAICDALLGAASLEDIGYHFPNSNPKYKAASSISLLIHVNSLLKEKEFTIQNIDSTIVLETPKLSPYIPQMKDTIAKALEVEKNQISIKATTAEGLGDIGKGLGAEARAIALLIKNS